MTPPPTSTIDRLRIGDTCPDRRDKCDGKSCSTVYAVNKPAIYSVTCSPPVAGPILW